MSDERDDKLERFEEELRRWGQRPAATPPSAAATRVRARIGSPRPGARPAWGLAWAAAVVMAVAGSWLVGRGDRPAPSPTPRAAHEKAVALPDNVVLWWLDPETPVYFVIHPAEPEEGER